MASIAARFWFATTASYIHPDEHFQSLQPMTSALLQYSCPLPWEFDTIPSRSLAPLYLVYGPILSIINWFGYQVPPLTLWYIFRLILFIFNWLITDYVLYKLLPTKPERIKAVFFISTSYITLVHQSHLFSNSLETPLVLLSLLIINDMRGCVESNTKVSASKLITLSFIVVLGIFNRITFVAFLALPCWFVACYIWKNPLSVLVLSTSFMLFVFGFIVVDTLGYHGNFNHGWVIAPWNNLKYNSSVENLSTHGLHPLYTHILVNLPQLLGPGLVLLFTWKLSNKYWRTIPFLSIISSLVILSTIPHQELRFLMPVLPLAACCFDLAKFEKNPNSKNQQPSSWMATLTINSWLVFNFIMSLLMGVFHQGGVVPALDHIFQENIHGTQIWWRTYSPPTWMLADTNNSTQFVTINDENPTFQLSENQNIVMDTMGIEKDLLHNVIQQLGTKNLPVYLITPTASFNTELNNTIMFEDQSFEEVWHYRYHIDMDHLDFGNIESLKPGISIYKLI